MLGTTVCTTTQQQRYSTPWWCILWFRIYYLIIFCNIFIVDTLRAAFSAPAPEYLNAQVVYAQPASGCSVPTNNVTGKIVIFDAGLCVQITIAQNLLAAGAAAGLSNFNSPTLLNVYSSATFGSVNIPFYYISSTAVSIIKPFIQNGTYVTATLGYQPSPTTHVNALLDFYAATGGTTSWRFGLSTYHPSNNHTTRLSIQENTTKHLKIYAQTTKTSLFLTPLFSWAV